MTEVESKIIAKEVGHLRGHTDWVTSIVTGHPQKENEDTQVLITASRDRTILIWKFNHDARLITEFGEPVRSLTGHSHFISDLALTNENNHLLSCSWDRTMRLWDLRTGKTTQTFVEGGHTKEILSCAISADGRYILSSGADKEIKLWNVKGKCKHTVKDYNHNDWVSRVRFISTSNKSSLAGGQFFGSVGWDGYLKIWNNQNFGIKDSFRAHDTGINALTVSPKGNFIVTGGKDKKVKVFDFSDVEKSTFIHDAGSSVNCLAFNPRTTWIAIGTELGWQIWDFEAKDSQVIADGNFMLETKQNLEEKSKKVKVDKFHQVTSIQWNTIGNRLYVGYSNGDVKVYDITEEKLN